MKKNAFALLAILLFTLPLFAQNAPQHPRALEIEKMLQKDLQGVIHDMMPEKPFYVSVKVTPLRRESAKTQGKENLPYYETSEEIRDEWDDPAKTEYDLMQRVSKISVKLSVPNSLSNSQVEDLKAAVKAHLSLVDGRDDLNVETKEFSTPGNGPSWFMITAFLTLCFFGIGYAALAMFSSRRLSKAIQNVKVNPAEGGAGAAPAAPQMSSFPGFDRHERKAAFGLDSQVQFQDTLKMMEVVTGLMKTIQASPSFPTLEDMVLFDKYVEENPSATGALLSEFPTPVRHKIFSLTYANHWLKAMTEPGKMDSSSFELINRLARIERSSKNPKWEELLICCWRLNDKLSSFLRRADQQDAIAILKVLPQSLALKVAREIMPGEWATVLKPSDAKGMSNEKIEKYLKLAYAEHPLRSVEVLDQYKKDIELANFLRTADPVIEKEVYGALPANSTLFKIRPPFFQILEADATTLKEFVPRVNIDEWALALMNVNKSARSQVDQFFFDRQKFRFVELLRAYDRSGVSPESVGQVREKLARLFQSQQQTVPSPMTQSVTESLQKEAA